MKAVLRVEVLKAEVEGVDLKAARAKARAVEAIVGVVDLTKRRSDEWDGGFYSYLAVEGQKWRWLMRRPG